MWDLLPRDDHGASPFGSEIHLDDFPCDELTSQEIASGFLLPTNKGIQLAKKVLAKTDGHPRLTMMFCRKLQLKKENASEDALEQMISKFISQSRTDEETGIIRQIEGFLFRDKLRRDEALTAYRGILAGDPAFTEHSRRDAVALLKRSGLVKVRGGRLDVKNSVFRQCCDVRWADNLSLEFAKDKVVPTNLPKDRKNVVLINTGGTLGMVEKSDGIVVAETYEEWKSLFPELDNYARVRAISAFEPIDSANIYPSHWTLLANQINALQGNPEVRAVIVVHGTDTMAYTASALALALGSSLRFPVILTGSQAPPNSYHGDARNNLYRAFLVATSSIAINEVIICFDRYVFRGCRAQKKDDRDFAGFHSPSCPELAHITSEDVIVFQDRLLNKEDLKYSEFQPDFTSRVLTIRQSPGLDPSDFRSAISGPDPVGGIVFQTLGAGNVPSQKPFEFINFIRDATAVGIPVVITSQYAVHPSTHTRYAPGIAPIEAGAIPVGDMTSEAAETKLRWVLAQIPKQVNTPAGKMKAVTELMHRNFVGEINQVFFSNKSQTGARND
jgi:L-asparaginase